MTQPKKPDFTPALGPLGSIGLYDRVIALMTREDQWRSAALYALSPLDGETIVDIGSGTGSMAALIKSTQPGIRMIAIDPDPKIRKIAERKARKAGTTIEFVTALGDAVLDDQIAPASVDRILISLVLHQCPNSVKVSILDNAFRLLKPSGQILIADFGKQRSLMMQLAFNLVRLTDGYDDTKANKNGQLPRFMKDAGFVDVQERMSIATLTGSISIYVGNKPS
jgi:ubiquinone/menaquinone biosynthesis C-methylase UbiE